MLIFLLALMTVQFAEPLPAGETLTGAAGVIDGDTIRVAGAKVRFHGMDAPERGSACAGIEGDCGAVAARRLQALIDGRAIVCTATGTASYDRQVAVCRAGALDLGGAMVETGWAKAAPRFTDRYVKTEQLARERRAGSGRTALTPRKTI